NAAQLVAARRVLPHPVSSGRAFDLSWRGMLTVKEPLRTGSRGPTHLSALGNGIMSKRSTRPIFAAGPVLVAALWTGCATPAERRPATWPRYVLSADQSWQLNLPGGERFDASGLLLSRRGDLLTVNDRTSAVYRVQFLPGQNAADLA